MNPILKVLIVTLLVCLGLYLGVSEFLGTTDRLKGSLDVKSLAYIRDENPDEDPRLATELKSVAASRNPAKESPGREQSSQIDATTVKASPEKIQPDSDAGVDKVSDKQSDQDTDVLVAIADSKDRLKESLGMSEPPPTVRAVDVVYEIPSECDASAVLHAPIPVKYRYESPTIKGSSLAELELLIAEYRRCDGGIFHLSYNPLGKEDATPVLMQRRLDELKYYFLQHRVPKAALRFPEIHD